MSLTKRITIAITVLFLLLVMWYAKTIVLYVVTAVVLVLILLPFNEFLAKLKIKNSVLPGWLRALLSLVLIGLVISVFVMIFMPILIHEIELISKVDYNAIVKYLSSWMLGLEPYIQKTGIDFSRANFIAKVYDYFDVSALPNALGNILSSIGSILAAIFSISFISFFLLKDKELIFSFFKHVVNSLVSEKHANYVFDGFYKIKHALSRYFIGLLFQVSLIAILVSTVLWILDIENAFIIGFFAGIINVIPYLGPIFGFLFGVIVALTTNVELAQDISPLLVKLVFVFASIQLLDNFVFQPFIFSNSIKAHPLEIFLVILVFGQLFGIIGMVIAVPGYSIIRVVSQIIFAETKLFNKEIK